MNDASEQILEQFKEWLVAEEDGALRAGNSLNERGDWIDARICFGRSGAFEDARLKLTELGVKFD